jgi:hypothetical protein
VRAFVLFLSFATGIILTINDWFQFSNLNFSFPNTGFNFPGINPLLSALYLEKLGFQDLAFSF